MRWPAKKALSSGVFLLGLGGPAALAAGPDEWRSRSIYQVLTDRFALPDGGTETPCNTDDRVYCGGNYHGIINRLDYIQDMGFSAIWISPVTLNVLDGPGGSSYHGYWQKDIYQLNPRFGLGRDLRALSDELHARGMYLMVDVVVNHYGWDGDADTVDYSQLVPFDGQSFFHPACNINYNDQSSIEDCWLATGGVSLPDVKTEDANVVRMYSDWIRELVSNFTIDGLRIDTAKHVDTAFWPEFNQASGVFSTGEVFNGDPAYTCPYQEHMDSVLNYPIYYSLKDAFSSPSGSMPRLAAMIQNVKSACRDSTLLGSFSENHDVPRFASLTDDLSLAKNVMAYTILADGVPIVYSGQEQHYAGGNDPSNREAVWLSGYRTDAPLYVLAASLNRIRNHAIRVDGAAYLTYKNWPIYTDTTTIAMRKGSDDKQIVTVLSNKGAGGDAYAFTLQNHGFAAGSHVVEVLSCTEVAVGGDGKLRVAMESGLPRVFYAASRLSGSGLCDR